MAKARRRQFQRITRRTGFHRSNPWILFFEITGISPGEIRFMACGGGQAKCKALPKLQSVLAREVGKDCGNPRVKAFLKRVGPGDNGAPSYVLRKWYSNCGKIMSTKSSSRVFRVKDSNNNGHGGNGHH